jgi:hypothetical protein
VGKHVKTGKRRAEQPVSVNVTPGTGHCHHHRFMWDCRNTAVPICTDPPEQGSLYCRSHQQH